MAKFGATGNFPRGKLNKADEGGLRIGIGHEDNVVVVRFGKKISWIGMPKRNAIEFAKTIMLHAEQLTDDQ